ncbi:hypothetical protein vseg_010305 [Gypsophila vaccaria]
MTMFLAKNPLHTYHNIPYVAVSSHVRRGVVHIDRTRLFCKPAAEAEPFICAAALPARDTVIDFGKYKGRMLGTLPSTYLKWVSNNLCAQHFEDWPRLAHQVLQDPVYNDRVEWEYAERLLTGDGLKAGNMSVDAVAELVEISQRFGWDNEDKLGWSRIDFQKLGTSGGGRIPRVKDKTGAKHVSSAPVAGRLDRGSRRNEGKLSVSETRIERRERLRTRRSVTNVSHNERSYNVGGANDGGTSSVGSSDTREASVYNPFPGRETLLKKVLSRRKIG